MMFIRLGGKSYSRTSKLRIDTNRKDSDIKNDPEVLLERYIYENRLQMEEKGNNILFLSSKTCII